MISEAKTSSCTTTALEPAEAREVELLWRNRQLAAFQRISEAMLADKEEPELFNTIAHEASEITGFPIAAIEQCDFERQLMVYRGVHGISLENLPKPFEVPMGATLSGRVAHTGKVLVETDGHCMKDDAAPFLRQLAPQTFVCVPIRANGKVIGTLTLAHRERVDVDPQMVKQAASMANYLAAQFDRLRTRQAADRAEAELAAVYDHAPGMICLIDDRLRIVRANRATAEFSGRTKAELISLRIGDLLKCPACARYGAECGATDKCRDCELHRALTETFDTGKGWHRVRVKKSLLRKNGNFDEVILLVSTEWIQLADTARVLMSLEDITHTVRADEQIGSQAALLDVTQDAIFVRDFSDRILYWNDGAQRLYGWTMLEARGKTSTELLSTGNSTTQLCAALEAVRKDGQWSGELREKTRDGRQLIIESRWTAMNERKGTPRAILVVNRDVTEKKKLEAQLLRAQRLESIGTLASGLAHDLNNVLAPILMTVSFLKEEIEDEGTASMIQTVETCARRGAHIVRQVLTFARGVEGVRVLLQPRHLIEEMERIGRETFPRSLHIQTQICKQPWLITGDSTQLQQVLMNLWVNARDAMPEGGTLTTCVENVNVGPEVLQSHPKAKPGPYVLISVTDTGTGIPPELIDKIFDPFFTTKPVGQGTGLGLPTVLGIVESHGGILHVDSQPGKGTVFKVYLPATPTEKERDGHEDQSALLPDGNGETILVVDDEPAMRDIASRILKSHGYRPLTACEGNEALALFELNRDNVKAVVSDLMMPRMDGPATIRSLRKMKPDIKTIMITGLGEEARVAEAKAAGSDVVLTKPFTAEQLLETLRQLLA